MKATIQTYLWLLISKLTHVHDVVLILFVAGFNKRSRKCYVKNEKTRQEAETTQSKHSSVFFNKSLLPVVSDVRFQNCH